MNLVIDIGNNRIKAAVFEGMEMHGTITDEEKGQKIYYFLRTFEQKIDRCIISSVTELPKNLKKIEPYIANEPCELKADTPVPFNNKYATKETLGKDRVAAIAAACGLYPGKNVLVIDAGTAITYDFKTSAEEYIGGDISPGLTMRFRALHDFTARLPLVNVSSHSGLLGTSTESAIQNGVQNGLIFEMNSYIETLSNKYTDLLVLLTGGDAPFFDNKLKKTIFVVSNLTLIGLNIILQYNAERY